jgi:hypothetical protein
MSRAESRVAASQTGDSLSRFVGVITSPSVILAAAVVVAVVLLWIKLRRDQFFLLIASVVVSLALGEALCRALDLGGREPHTFREMRAGPADAPYPYLPNTELVYEYASDPRGYFGPGNEVVGHINSFGFRGPEPRPRGSGAAVRIVMLGDSFAVGFGVRDEDTLPAQLERVLRSRSHDVEVLNLGASATSTPEQVDLLEGYALEFEPDVVVILFFLNDTRRLGTNVFLTQGVWFRWLRARSCLADAVVTAAERVVVTRQMVRHYNDGYREASPGWVEVRAAFLRARELARTKGFELVVAVHPVLFRLDESHPFLGIHRTVAEFLSAEGIERVDLLDAFIGQNDEDLWVHPTDHHPNELAHGMSAALLADALVRSGVMAAR